jgi:hypothetical protein
MEKEKNIVECKTNKHPKNFIHGQRINYQAYEKKIGFQKGHG